MLIAEIIGSAVSLLIVVLIFVIGGIDYSTSQFNSVNQALIPNLVAFFILLIGGIFLPWLVVYLRLRKDEKKPTNFKDWRKLFLRTSIGSIAFLSVSAFSFVLYYISRYGPWPSWNLPNIADFYGYMVIANLSAIIYLAAFIMMLILWFITKKEEKIAKMDEKSEQNTSTN